MVYFYKSRFYFLKQLCSLVMNYCTTTSVSGNIGNMAYYMIVALSDDADFALRVRY